MSFFIYFFFFEILSALASRDRHLGLFGSLGASFLTFWEPFWHPGSTWGSDLATSGAPWGAILAPREHLGRPFWYLGTTLEDHGSSRMDTKLQMTGFLSILEWFRDLFMSVFGVQNVLKIVFFLFLICFQVTCLSISNLNFRCLGLQNRCFRMEGIANIVCSWESFKIISGLFFNVLRMPWESFFWFFWPWKQTWK